MTRPYCTLLPNAKAVLVYIFRQGAEPIGGTVPALKSMQMRRVFDHLRRGKDMLHLTLSLPAGLHATNEQWLMIVEFVINRLRLPVNATPWVAARHVDAGCDHIHVAIALRDFLGNPLQYRGQQPHTEAISQDLARHLGLEVPQFFTPSLTRLSPITPARNLRDPARQRLHAALNECFLEHQPETLAELDALLEAPPHSYRREESANAHGVISSVWHGPDGKTIRGGALGRAWEPRHLTQRLEYAGALRLARADLEALFVVQAFAELPNIKEIYCEIERNLEVARAARLTTGSDGRVGAHHGRDQATASAPRLASENGCAGAAVGGNPAGDGLRDRRHQHSVGADEAGLGGEKEGKRCADGAGRPDRGDVARHPGREGGQGGLLIRAAIRARALARDLGQWLRIEFLWTQRALRLYFMDESALILSRQGTVLDAQAGLVSDAFIFAEAHAKRNDWLFLPECPEWPVAYRGKTGERFSAPAGEVSALRAQILRMAEIEQLPGSDVPPAQLLSELDTLHLTDTPEPVAQKVASLGPRRRFLVVTNRCTSPHDPGLEIKITWLEERHRGEPGLQILFLDHETGTLERIRLNDMLARLCVLAALNVPAKSSEPDGTGGRHDGSSDDSSTPEPEKSEDDNGFDF